MEPSTPSPATARGAVHEALPGTEGVDAKTAGRMRREALSPHYEEFLGWAWTEVDPQAVPHLIELRNRPIELGSWERGVVQQAGLSSGGDDHTLSLLAEGVAVQIKYSELLDRFDHGPMPPPEDLPGFLQMLVADLAVGFALLQVLQSEIDRRIEAGRLAEAKSVAAFRARVAQSLAPVKGRVGTEELEEAERRARRMVPARLPTPSVPSDASELMEEEPETPNWATYGRREEPEPLPPWLSEAPPQITPRPVESEAEEPRSRIKPLLIVLAALIVVYALVLVPSLRTPGPPELTLDQFSQIEVIQSLTARPPSLYVVLDGPRWRDATPGEQLQWLQEMGAIADQAGYSGIHARASDGTTVAEWMRETGARLVASSAGAS